MGEQDEVGRDEAEPAEGPVEDLEVTDEGEDVVGGSGGQVVPRPIHVPGG